MSKNKNDHGKSGGKDHDDHNHGHGHKELGKLLVGTNGDDTLAGGSRNDVIIGRKGDDWITGGAGNDLLIGDGGWGGKGWHWIWGHWGKPRGSDDDYLDGGAGSDRILAGKGDDVANYTLSENSKKAHDVYDGGKGFDTLQLTLTHAEFQLASVQKDIADFEAFLAKKANAKSDDGKTFEFKSFNLDVRNFEDLVILLPNRAPIAQADTAATNEDTQLIVAGPGLLANDSDPDASDVVSIVGSSALSAMGAVVFTNPDGAYIYDPSNALLLQQLGQGESATDTFSYTITDLAGATATATVSIEVTGVNDGPVADDDAYEAAEDTTLAVAGPGVLANDTDIDGDALNAILVSGPAHGTLGLNADGSFSYLAHADYFGNDSFTYRASDGMAESATRTVAIKVTDVNDAPITAPDTFSVAEDGGTSGINVLGNDSAGPANEAGQALRVTGAFADHGSVAINVDGTLNYVAGPDFVGTDTIHYTASDNGSSNGVPDHRTALGQVTVTVTEVNDAPVAFDDVAFVDEDSVDFVIDVLGNDSAGPANEAGQLLSVVSATALHGSVSINEDGTLSYTPDADYFGSDTISYTMSDDGTTNGAAAPLTASAQVAVTVNDEPEAGDVELPGGTGGGAIRVAVIGGSTSTYIAAADQLNDEASEAYDLDAFAIPMSASMTEEEWAAMLAEYDVVVIGENGSANVSDYNNSQIFAALRDFVDAGGGVVTTGLFAGEILAYSAPAGIVADADYISPAAPFGSSVFATSGSAIDVLPVSHPITDGVSPSYAAQGFHELAGATDAGAVVLARSASGLTAIAYDEVGDGRTVYLGSVHMAEAGFLLPNLTRDGNVDRIFEQAVAWAAGEPESGATTSQDSPYEISAALLLPGTPDAEGDEIFIESVSSFSALGAEVYLDEDGNVVYDPTESEDLKSLDEGEVATDSFTYTLADGPGAMGFAAFAMMSMVSGATGDSTGTVTLTVKGVNDAPEAQSDSRITNEDTPISGNVLDGDSDPEGDALAVLAAGTFTTARGAQVILGADGGYSYDPTGSAELQALGSGESLVDSFDYTISDGKLTDTASVSVTVLGRNESTGGTTSNILPQVPAGAELDYYVRFNILNQPEGEWLALEGFALGGEVPVTLGSVSGGASVSKPKFSEVDLTLGSSAAIVKLTDAIAKGLKVNVEVEAYRPGGGDTGGMLVDEYRFDQAVLSGLVTSGSPEATSEQVSFNFTKITHTHQEQDQDGKIGDAATTTYDVALNKTTSSTAKASADAIDELPVDGLPVGAELDYYVTYEGAGGWLELEGFSVSLSNTTSVGSASGGAIAGKVKFDGATLELGTSNALVKLMAKMTSGQDLEFLEVEAYRTGAEGKQLIDEYYFDTVFLDSLDTTGSANSVGIVAGKFSHGHLEYRDNGSIGNTTVEGWSFLENKDWTPSGAPDADAAEIVPLSQVPAGAELDYYVRFNILNQPEGEWLALEGFALGGEVPVTLGSVSGGASVSKPKFSEVDLTLGSSAAIVKLTDAIAKGLKVNVEVEAYRPGGGDTGGMLVDEYRFDQAVLSGLVTSGSPEATSEQVSFNFTKITHTHQEQDQDGKIGDAATTTYDVALNKTTSSTAKASADAIDELPVDGLPVGAELDYYVTYEGAGGWLELEGFSVSLSNTTSVGSASGGAIAGKVKFDGATLELGTSNALVKLMAKMTSGQDLEFLEVEAYRTGAEGKQLIDEYYFDTVFLDSLDTTGSANSVGIVAGKFSHGHLEYRDNGSIGNTTVEGWSFLENKDWTPSGAPDADAAEIVPLSQVPAGAELDYYVRFNILNQPEGEWLALEGFALGGEVPVTLGSVSGGASVSKPKFSEVDLTLGSSAAIVKLTDAIAKGLKVNVEVEAYRPGGGDTGGMLVDEYRFDQAVLSGLVTSGSPEATSEQVSFNFTKITHTHQEQDQDGKIGDAATTTYDVALNKTTSSTAKASADAIDELPVDGLPVGAELDYYVTYEGAGGWLELEGFSVSLSNTTSVGSASGGAIAGKVKFDGATLELGTSNALVKLMAKMTSGQDLEFLEVEAYRTGAEGKQLIDEYYFDTVFLDSLDTTGSANSVGIVAGKFSHGHLEYRDNGSIGNTTVEGWSFLENKDWNSPAPDADLF